MRKWMVEFLSKYQSHVIKIARVNSLRMTKWSTLGAAIRILSETIPFSYDNIFAYLVTQENCKINNVGNVKL